MTMFPDSVGSNRIKEITDSKIFDTILFNSIEELKKGMKTGMYPKSLGNDVYYLHSVLKQIPE